ncbi:MAG: cytochrome c-type biogenesis protein CcmH [Alphaproteobacteria bacterium]|nr:cytochrome c-type biogenesis protein CcmH [Alphaproteobacteria bacterium]
MPILFWIIALGMALGAAALIAYPLLRARHGDASRGAHALEVYRRQLAELEGELARGVISASEAEGARLEIERRMLRAHSEAGPAPESSLSTGRGRNWLAAGLALVTPMLAFAVYLAVGNPDPAPDRAAAQVKGADTEHMDMLALTEKLAARLAANPGDVQGWMLLGRSYVTLADYPKALAAYGKAVALASDKPAPMVLAEYAETLVQANNGLVGEDAQEQFRKVLKIVPAEPRSQFYLGLAKAQAGDAKGALAGWVALLKQAEPGAPWAGAVRAQAQEVADMLKVDLAALVPEPALPPAAKQVAAPVPKAGPDAEAMAAAAEMPEGDRKKMIEGMVARLAARLESTEKTNTDGWLQLARAYGVLGRKADSLAALGRAVETAPDRMDALSAYGEALQAAGETNPVSERFANTMRQILAVEPVNNQALWFLGAFSAQKGDRAAARDYWEKLRGQLPPDTDEYRSVSSALNELGKS